MIYQMEKRGTNKRLTILNKNEIRDNNIIRIKWIKKKISSIKSCKFKIPKSEILNKKRRKFSLNLKS